MKIIKLFLIVFFSTFLYTNCAPHCDDEDYRRDQKEAALTKTDSLAVLRQ